MKILVVGDAILDKYIYGNVERYSPEDPSVPVLDFEKEETRFGGCLNVALNIKSLGHNVSVDVWSVVSGTTAIRLAQKEIKALRPSIISTPQEQEISKTRIIHNERQLLRVDNFKQFNEIYVKHFHKNTMVNFYNYDCIVVSDYCKGFVNDFIIDKLSEYNQPVFIDTKKKNLVIWKNIQKSILKINHRELETSTNSFSVENLIVTEGSNGATWYFTPPPTRGRITKHFPVDALQNPDVTGCGDVFLAGLVVEYMETRELEKSIQFANRVARLNAKKFGVSTITRKDLENEI